MLTVLIAGKWRLTRVLVQLTLGAVLLLWLLARIHPSRIVEAVGEASWTWLGSAIILLLLAPLPAAARLFVLFHARGLSFAAALRVTLVSYFFNQILPTGLGGDLYRVARLRGPQQGWTATLALVGLERGIGLATLLVPATAIAGWQAIAGNLTLVRFSRVGSPSAVVLFSSLAAALAGVLLLARYRVRLRATLLAVRSTLKGLSARDLSWITVLSLAFHGFRILGMACLLMSLRYRISADELLVAMAIALIATMVPLSIGALGVQEGALVLALGAFGVPAAPAMAAALLNRGALMTLGAAGALLLFSREGTNSPGQVA